MSKREPLPAETYARVFENHAEGKQILEELVTRFGGNPYKRGGLEAQRETDRCAGQLSVVHFILGRINQAHGVPDHDDTES